MFFLTKFWKHFTHRWAVETLFSPQYWIFSHETYLVKQWIQCQNDFLKQWISRQLRHFFILVVVRVQTKWISRFDQTEESTSQWTTQNYKILWTIKRLSCNLNSFSSVEILIFFWKEVDKKKCFLRDSSDSTKTLSPSPKQSRFQSA